jgi:hypothetical protein
MIRTPAQRKSPGGNTRGKDQRGIALLVALGVLVVLALLGAVFATMSGIERTVARNYIDKVRARFLAESGIEQAIAELGVCHGRSLDIWNATRPMPWTYFGLDSNGDGLVNNGESAAYSYTLPSGEIMHDWGRCPIEEATRPSFPYDYNGNGSFDPASDCVTIDGKSVALSGAMQAGTYAERGNVYTLKVTDLQSRININNRHANMVTILNNLGRRLNVPTLGTDVVAARNAFLPDQRLATLDQLIKPSGPYDRATVDRLRPYITVNGWVNEKTLRPIGLTPGRRWVDPKIGDGVFAWHEMRPRKWSLPTALSPNTIEDLEPRSPININTAPFEVLAALFEGLQGFYLEEIHDPWTELDPYDWVGVRLRFTGTDQKYSGKIGYVHDTPAIGPKTAANIAAEIIKVRQTFPAMTGSTVDPLSIFRSYQQFADFLDRLPSSVYDAGEVTAPAGVPIGIVQQMVREVIKANCNPNCHLNELNPDDVVATKIDKVDLLYWTTEINFIPMGYFEIESLGRVVDSQRREIASEKIVVQAKLFDLHMDTTQADFQRDFFMDDAGEKVDLPGTRGAIDDRLRLSFSSSGSGAYPVEGHLAAYPEFYMEPRFVRDSVYDGYIGLQSTWCAPNSATLRARFKPCTDAAMPDKSMDAFSSGSGGGAVILDAGGGPYYEPLIGAAKPGSLMPDGLLSEKDTSPGYTNRGNFNQHQGTLAMWVKPAFEPERAGKIRLFLSLTTYDLSGYTWGGPSNGLNSWPVNMFGICYLANHDLARYPEEKHPITYADRNTQWPCRSLGVGYAGSFNRPCDPNNDATKTWIDQPANMNEPVAFQASGCLNHIGHGHDSYTYLGNSWGNFLTQGRWIHIGIVWNDSVSDPRKIHVYVNGFKVERPSVGQNLTTTYPNTLFGEPANQVDPSTGMVTGIMFGLPPDMSNPTKYKNGQPDPPPLRLGGEAQSPAVSDWFRTNNGNFIRDNPNYPTNYPADATIDQFMTWPGMEDPQKILSMWAEGRYYKSFGSPDKSGGGTLANFTSPRIRFTSVIPRTLPPMGTASGGPPTGTISVPASASTVRLGLVTFSFRVPNYYASGLYPSAEAAPKPRILFDILDADTRSSLLAGSTILGEGAASSFTLGGGLISADGTATGAPIDISNSKSVRYRFWIDSGIRDRLNDPYIASPIVDEVLLTYSRPRPEILSWTVGTW